MGGLPEQADRHLLSSKSGFLTMEFGLLGASIRMSILRQQPD